VGYKLELELQSTSGDCDDNDKERFPGNPEICDGKDNNCDKHIDEDVKPRWYKDADNDGYSDRTFQDLCERPEGYKLESELKGSEEDCNDNDDEMSPGNTEVCDGKDNDCNGLVDEAGILWYKDADNDGYSDGTIQEACERPKGHKIESELKSSETDCDDGDPDEFPGQIWYKDGDNDGYSDETSQESCERSEGYKLKSELQAASGDCNDNDKNIFPGNPEICDGKDNDCNGETDECCIPYCEDADSDGHGNFEITVQACTPPEGYLICPCDDSDDSDPLIFPDGSEHFDRQDNDCDGQIDEYCFLEMAIWSLKMLTTDSETATDDKEKLQYIKKLCPETDAELTVKDVICLLNKLQ
jgi:hypothetical protein